MKFFRIFLLLTEIFLTFGKIIRSSVFFHEKIDWQYLGKFAINIGTGKYSMRLRVLHSTNPISAGSLVYLHFNVFLDEDWEAVLQKQSCNDKTNLRRASHFVTVPHNGDWSDPVQGDLSQSVREHVWFFTLSDCQKSFASLGGTSIQAEITVLNSDGSHFSSEEKGMLTFSFHSMWISALLTLLCFFRVKKLNLTREEPDYPTIVLTATMLLLFAANFFETIHLWSLSSSGKGNEALNVMGMLAEASACFLLSSLCLLLAWGWRIRFMSIEESDWFIPSLLLLGAGTVVTVSLSHLDDSSSHKYHEYEGFGGIFLVIIRIAFFIYFAFGIVDSFLKGNDEVKSFCVKFGLLGTLYFCSFPFVLGFVKFLPPYVRHKFIVIGMGFSNSATTLALFQILASNRSFYYKVSYHNRTLLPQSKFE